MKIYIGHSNDWDYKNKLYKPILNSKLSEKHEIIFPHINNESFNTKEVIKTSDLFIAEVSRPSLGLGIEIGRAEQIGKRILCIYEEGQKCSSSLKYVNVTVITYKGAIDMVNKIESEINKIENQNGSK